MLISPAAIDYREGRRIGLPACGTLHAIVACAAPNASTDAANELVVSFDDVGRRKVANILANGRTNPCK